MNLTLNIPREDKFFDQKIVMLKKTVVEEFLFNGPIRTGRKFVYLDRIFVITNALQVRMICRDLTILAEADKTSNAPPTKFVPSNNWTKSFK